MNSPHVSILRVKKYKSSVEIKLEFFKMGLESIKPVTFSLDTAISEEIFTSEFAIWMNERRFRDPKGLERELWKLAETLCGYFSKDHDAPDRKDSAGREHSAPDLLRRKGISSHWFLNVFSQKPEVRRLIDYECPMWFVRNYCIPLMLKRRSNAKGSYMTLLEREAGASNTQPKCEHDFEGPFYDTATVFISYTGSYTIDLFIDLVYKLAHSHDAPDHGHYLWVDMFCVDQFAWNQSEG